MQASGSDALGTALLWSSATSRFELRGQDPPLGQFCGLQNLVGVALGYSVVVVVVVEAVGSSHPTVVVTVSVVHSGVAVLGAVTVQLTVS